MKNIVYCEEAVRRGIENPAWQAENSMDTEQLRKLCGAFVEENEQMPIGLKRAHLLKLLLENAQIAVEKGDIFADRVRHGNIMAAYEAIWKKSAELQVEELRKTIDETQDGVACCAWNGYADISHVSPDWKRIYKRGLTGMIQDVLKAGNRAGITREQKDFYESAYIALEAMRTLCERLADAAESVKQDDALAFAAENLRAIGRQAPQTFAQALQMVLLIYNVQTNMEGSYVRTLGRMDQELYDLYRADIDSGRCSREEIACQLRFFYMRFTALNHPNNVPLCSGGVDGIGPGGINDLSELMLDVYDEMGLYCPKMQIRVNDKTPEEFIKRVLRSIRKGNSSYVLMNDDVVIESMERIGIERADAQDYVPVGCYEPSVTGKELGCTTAGTVSFLKAVELALFDGVDPMTGRKIGPECGDLNDYDAFVMAVQKQVEHGIAQCIRRVKVCERAFPLFHTATLYSALTESCVQKGMDAYAGGMKYNNDSINCIGLAGAVDAMMAVKKAVFEQKRVNMEQLRDMLRSNWQGAEKQRLYMLRRCDKYGSGSAEADACAARLVRFCADKINGVKNARGGVFRLGLFSIDWIYEYGNKTGATPDGRYAGEPLSKNLSAVIGMDMNGPTMLCRSAAGVDGRLAPNGAILDVMLHPSAVQGEEGIHAMLSLLRTFYKQNGQGIQYNVLDAQVLRDAQKEPEKYRSLQIRVCGWNAYFVNLSRKEQDDFIRIAELAC